MENAQKQQIINIIATHKMLDSSCISLETPLEELGVTSLDAITIAYEIEEALNIEIPNDQIQSIVTVDDIIKTTDKLLK
ncbi:MAG: acyl carrier protein [gamma proteobacterium symbiont of Bathyaustriella thionipta]|nr:acyl carrier protein [gamma proteobacterium symbiont of Bathyaustriella thionipta]